MTGGKKKTLKSRSKRYSCNLCTQINNAQMIECDRCDEKYHMNCVSTTSVDGNDQWFCPECLKQETSRQSQSNDKGKSDPANGPKHSNDSTTRTNAGNPINNRSGQNPEVNSIRDSEKQSHTQKSGQSRSVSSSLKQQTQLELERLEEERRMKEIRDKEYLDSKYRILQSDRHSSKSRSNASENLSVDRTSLTREWVRNQSVENQPPSASRKSFIEESIDDPEVREQIQEFSRKINEMTFDNTSPLNSTEQLIAMAYHLGMSQGHTESKSMNMNRTSHETPQGNPQLPKGKSEATDGQLTCQQKRRSCPAHDARLHMFRDGNVEGGPMSNSTFAAPARPEEDRKFQSTSIDPVRNETLEWDNYFGTQNNVGKYPTSKPSLSRDKRVESGNLDSTKISTNGHSDQRQATMTSVMQNPFEMKSSSQNTQSMGVDGRSVRRQSSWRDENFNEKYFSVANNPSRRVTHQTKSNDGNCYDKDVRSNNDHDRSQSNRRVEFHESTSFDPNRKKISNVDVNDDEDYDYDDYAASYSTSPGLSNEMRAGQIAARHVVDKKLPIFNGNPKEWLVWYCQYQNSTKLCGFSNGENLDRLQRCLKDEAKTAVKGYLMHPKLVPDIIDTLKTLFGRPELIIKATINEVKNFPPVKPDRLDQLMDFAFELQSMCTTIESLKRPNHLNDPLLVDDLVEKLPTQEKKEWARFKAGKENITVKTLSIWLYDLAKLLSSVTTHRYTKTKEHKQASEKEDKNAKAAGLEHVNIHVNHTSREKENQKSSGSSNKNHQKFPCPVCSTECSNVEKCSKFISFDINGRWQAVKDHRLCRICLRKHRDPCRVTTRCGKNGCQYRHNHLLHNDERHSTNTTVASNHVHTISQVSTLLRIIPVYLFNGIKSALTFAFFDEGSTATMMERSIANKLGLSGTSEQLCLIWTNNIHRQERAERVSLKISGANGFDKLYQMNGVRTVEELHLPSQTIRRDELVAKFPYLKGVPFADYEAVVPGILIGTDMAKLGAQLQIVESDRVEDDNFNGPMASRTRLGWVIHGPLNSSSTTEYANVHRFEMCPYHNELDNDIHQRVKEYFSVENFGVQANNVNLESKENERALEMLTRFTKKKNGRYETGLLWKSENVVLPDSYAMAVKRLHSLEKQGPDVIKILGAKIADYIAKGYAKRLSKEELKYDGPVWYLPLFGVVHPKKPGKLRMVFDAAAKVKSTSLNSNLLQGPDLYTSLIDILRRFRERLYTGGGDIAEMYHQVSINEKDRHCQRFLFRDETSKEPEIFVMKRMTFGANCSPATAQFIKNQNAKKFTKTHPRAVSAIIDSHYVDDMMDCEHTEQEMIQLMKDVKVIHAEAGFNIRNFISNSKSVLRAMGECQENDVKDIVLKTELKTERVLGMWYDTKNDSFTFSLKYALIDEKIFNGTKLPTKREILRTLMSIFDPLGLLSNFLIYLKILLQEIWKTKMNWDEQISSEDLTERWKKWLAILPEVENVGVPRLYSPKMSPKLPNSIQMHVFVDASADAFATAVYLRIEDDEGIDVAFVGSKVRVAPIKYLSIPRLELQASVLGTRLSASIVSAQRFKIDKRIIWSDSATVISWLNSDHRKYSQFVAHRVGEILENSDVHEWRWIPTKENVADEATKWNTPPNFDPSNRWFRGPDFLRLNENKWPEKKSIESNVEEEMKAHHAHSSFLIPQIINPERFSNYNRMVRALAYTIRFRKVFNGEARGKPLQQGELRKAESFIFRQAQFEGYPAEMATLERNKCLPLSKQRFIEKPSPLHDGTPYIDADGVLRLKWRIDGARDLSMDTKRPIVLPKESRITHLLLLNYHFKFHHRGHETVVNEIRQRFYIPQLRVALKKTRKRCQMCKVKGAHPIPPQMADLPDGRLATRFIPYSFVGIDYFGPIKISVGRRTEKRWGVLFTCLTIRAIHIEIASGLDTNSCILCIQNFIAEHGPVIEFHSDNGTNFRGADNELQREMKKIDPERLQTQFTTTYTKWIFNPPASPHMGGSWEKMIGSVKSFMDEMVVVQTPKEDMLRNVFKQIQNMVNSRPLTYVPLEGPEDEALTPNHFIKLSSNGIKPPCEIELDGRYLRGSWKEAQRLTEIFWKRFAEEYLPSIARRTKWHKLVPMLKPGDLVLIVDKNNPRNTYPKARIVETKIGSNGQVRSARVEAIAGTKTNKEGQICEVRKVEVWRPAHKLALLDVVASKDGLAQPNRETGGSVNATDEHDNNSKIVPPQPVEKPESTTTNSVDASSANETSTEFPEDGEKAIHK